MKKRLLIGSVIVILAVVVVTVVVTDDADHYDYDLGNYSGMEMKVKKVDAFSILVDDETIVIVSSLNDGTGYLSTIIRKMEGVWQPGFETIMPRVFTSTFLPDNEEFQLISDDLAGRGIAFSSSSLSLEGVYPAQKGKLLSAL